MTAPAAGPVDRLAPQSPTWASISLSPLTPRTRACIANVFRNSAHEALTDAERAKCVALAEKWEAA